MTFSQLRKKVFSIYRKSHGNPPPVKKQFFIIFIARWFSGFTFKPSPWIMGEDWGEVFNKKSENHFSASITTNNWHTTHPSKFKRKQCRESHVLQSWYWACQWYCVLVTSIHPASRNRWLLHRACLCELFLLVSLWQYVCLRLLPRSQPPGSLW